MSTPEQSGTSGRYHQNHGRKMSRRKAAANRKKPAQFLPDFNGLERRMMPATYTVNVINDSGGGSLRQAITDSNANQGSNIIDFDIGTGAKTISLLSALPTITVPVLIDGTSQPGYAGAPLIDVDGTGANDANGLDLEFGSGGSIIRGLVISNFGGDAILIASAGNVVQGSYIGTNAAGTAAAGNAVSFGGIVVLAANNTIGGLTAIPGANAGNVISGNNYGVVLGASGNLLIGNEIGTSAAGNAAIANTNDGVSIEGPHNTVGGTAVGAANVISGNTVDGIEINGTSDTSVLGNLIGTDSTGGHALGNAGDGVLVDAGSTNNTIGAFNTGAGNIIAGNLSSGIELSGVGTSGNLVANNLVGTNTAGITGLGNSVTGVAATGGATSNTISGNVASGNLYGMAAVGAGTSGNVFIDNLVGVFVVSGITFALPNNTGLLLQSGATNNTVGGSSRSAANIISGNSSDGINIGNTGTSGNLVENNYIGTDSANDTGLGNANGMLFYGDTNGGPTNNSIGPGNVISGNSSIGIAIYNTGTSHNLVSGNDIGTNAQGTGPLPNSNGVVIGVSASGNTIGGANVISGNSNDGVEITGAGTTGNVVAGNDIGTDSTGTVAIPNYAGVEIDSGATGNLIGSNGDGVNDTLERNILSGNLFAGVWMLGAGTDNNIVAGNFIGTDVTGTIAVGNGGTFVASGDSEISGGVMIDAGASDNLIGTAGQDGSDDAHERNVISGNAYTAIIIAGPGTTGNVVAGDYLGTTVSGEAALDNGPDGDGVDIVNGADGNWIGVNALYGPEDADQGNLISGNNGGNSAGVYIDPISSGNVIAGNLIGTDASGDDALPDDWGVYINGPSNRVGTTGQDGPGDALERNVIAACEKDGILIAGTAATGNVVAGNYVGTNAAGTAALGSGTGVLLNGGAASNWVGVNPEYGPENADQRNIVAASSSSGVRLDGAGTSGNVIAGNLIGLNVNLSGSVIDGLGDGFAGVELTSGASLNWIGVNAIDGPENALQANVISGSYIGVTLDDSGTTGNVVAGNLIGTDPTGTAAVPNQTFDAPLSWGVVIAVGASSNLIGTSGQDGANDALERNTIAGNTQADVYIYEFQGSQGAPTTGNVVAGNYIGTTEAGTAAVGSYDGVLISVGATNNWVGVNPVYGSENADQRNVIAGSSNAGVELSSTGTSGNTVAGNYIGTDDTGTHALPNYAGVEIDSGATGNLVGTNGDDVNDAVERNIISGNLFAGVWLTGAGTDQNIVAGNYLGTDVAGTVALANSNQQIRLNSGYTYGAAVEINFGASDNLIGTSGHSADVVGERNVISGNSNGSGIDILGSGTGGNVVAGNYIGTTATGAAALGDGDGIFLAELDTRNWIGVNSVYGAENADQANVISGNELGLEFYDSTDNVVAGNLIGTNASGSAAVANQYGVLFDGTGSFNLLGTSGQDGSNDALERNVISGNSDIGVVVGSIFATGLSPGTVTGNVVAGNFIGTNQAGTAAVANGTGVEIITDLDVATANFVGVNSLYGPEDSDQRNVISGNSGNGVIIEAGASQNIVAGNYIGLSAAGSSAVSNQVAGVLLATGASRNTIGGLTALLRNVIAGNLNRGIYISTPANSSAPTTLNVVEGNYIGTDASGLVPITGNTNDAISIDLSPGNIIGGTVAGAGNVMDTGGDTGIFIYGDLTRGPFASSSGNLIAGNIIGLAADGVTATGFGNAFDGIVIDSAPNTTIGGSVAAARNIISNNTTNAGAGILLVNFEQPDAAINTVVQGNYIGTDISGTLARGNFIGIDIEGVSSSLIGTDGQDGAADALEGNLISGNLTEGIKINATSEVVGGFPSIAGAAQNVVAGNLIGTQAGGRAALGNGADGLQILGGARNNWIGFNSVFGSATTDDRNILSGNIGDGVDVTGAGTTGNVVAGNYAGLDVTGTLALGNTLSGLAILAGASANTIGGTAAGAANVFSGNHNNGNSRGILINGVGTNSNLVIGNEVGTNAAGTAAVANDNSGILVSSGPQNNQIGGAAPADRNLVSGNALGGIAFDGAGTTGNLAQGNWTGLNAAGTGIIANLGGIAFVDGSSGNSAIGNVVSGNTSSGISMINFDTSVGSSNNLVQGNLIGTNPAGTLALGNAGPGVQIYGASSGNTIGGTTAAARNIISGNTSAGVSITGTGTSGNLVIGNYVGTNLVGTAALGNIGDGVFIGGGASNNWIGVNAVSGAESAAQRNVISGNVGNGVENSGAGTSFNTVAGNYIGTDDTGTVAIANYAGVEIDSGATNNLIGTNGDGVSDALERNILSGNLFAGVWTTGTGTDSNVVAGNYIGTDVTGNLALGNSSVVLSDSIDNEVGAGIVIVDGASNNLIGTTGQSADDAGQRNIISGNLDDGIDIEHSGTTGNVVAGNYIGTNAAGIAALENLGQGIEVAELTGVNWIGVNTVYGPENADQGNVISGNYDDAIQNFYVDGGVEDGNFLGTDPTGTVAIPNYDGVEIYNSSNILLGTSGQDGNIDDALERNIISGNNRWGVSVVTYVFSGLPTPVTSGNVVAGNYIGTNAAGTAALPNGIVSQGYGVWIWGAAHNNWIGVNPVYGAPSANEGNVISGNLSGGVVITNAGTSSNVIAGNFVGTNATGTAAIGNGGADGVEIEDGATGNWVGVNPLGGPETSLERNVISGNASDGVEINGAGTAGNTLAGNDIGINAVGNAALANHAGVEIDGGASGNTIGTNGDNVADVLERNIISGNLFAGVWLTGTGTDQNVVAGNYIGTDVTGTSAVGNGSSFQVDSFDDIIAAGVLIENGASDNLIGTTGQSSDDAGQRNIISGNQNFGVELDGSGTSENVVAGNDFGTTATGESLLENESGSVELTLVTSTNWIGVNPVYGPENADQGNVISGGSDFGGVEFFGSSDIVVAGNLIGTDATGSTAIGSGTGVLIEDSSDIMVGESEHAGADPVLERNIISGNNLGVWLLSDGAPGGLPTTGNVISGNDIGTNSAGTAALNNLDFGIWIDGASSNTIGGSTAGAGNVISANAGYGVEIQSSSSTLVAGNWIGTNATGTAKLGNAGDGVYVNQSSSTTIGGTAIGAGNLISGNTNGIEINDSSATLVQGNLIGLDQSGTLALGNTQAGVLVDAGSSASTIGGAVGGARNFISGNAEGVMVTGTATTGTIVAGNFVGTDSNGIVAVGNLTAGITISGGSGITIGGTTSLARNVISGNLGDGVDLGSGATTALLEGNYFGLDQTGSVALGNAGIGVSVNAAHGVTVGGTAQGAGNVISGNVQSGVSIQGAGATGALVLGNLVGTDKTAENPLGNGAFGVLVSGTPGVTIGGTGAGDRNIISGNLGAGIGLLAGTTGAVIQGNLIGTDVTGSGALGNASGVLIDGGSANNTIGGTAAGAGNTIAFSSGIGVNVMSGTGDLIRLNSIFSDTGLGIALGGALTTNAPGGPHTGPDNLQNYPVVTSVVSTGGTTTVMGTFSSTPSTNFELDFYTLSSTNASGFGEGRFVLGSQPIATDVAGNASFTFLFPTPAGGAQFVTAAATDPGGNTSEFSQEIGGDDPPTARIGFSTLQVNEGAPISFDGTASTSPDGDPLSYTWSFGDSKTATGPDPTHTYLAQGTDTVTLTVADGFGGTSTAQATITVVDVPPVFTPDSFIPPLTYTTPAPGSGFGTSIASVDGNVAIGAPSANTTGAVYLYDGVPTDDGISSTYVYGALIRSFADPNPEPGDEFGASLAVVGNELVVGAPGSSLSGPGNGVVYVFDANSDSTTFGDLLATLKIPDADAQGDAQFGASVGTTDTNIVIGAPGRDGGTGAVYEFEGDTTQANFGDKLLTISPPVSEAGALFGAAVAGLGTEVIVGSPLADQPGNPTLGKVFLFGGTTLITTIINPDSGTSGFGSAVAAVGSNILIGSPQDDTAGLNAGAAFLYSAAGAPLMTFIQPDGGGGNFGASVAGTQNTALIGAPGATLGTEGAGAAYLFDAAGVTSPTFGQAIAAVQEATPTAGDLFGTAVGFDDAGMIVGAPGSGATAVGAADLYQPGALVSTSSVATYATAGPNDSVIVSGTFLDANPAAPLKASIDWGDGSNPTAIDLLAGSYAFSAPHDYTTDAASRYVIGVTLRDLFGETAFAQTTLAISDPAPEFAAPGLVLSSASIDENGSVSVSGTIVSPGGIHTNTVSIDWGDGSTDATIVLDPGETAFSANHTYLNNPAGEVSGSYTVDASVTNEEGKVGTAETSVAVTNVAPQFTASDLSLSAPVQNGLPTANEGDTVTLDGQFTDPGTLDLHTVTIDWGDGGTSTVLYEQLGQVVASATPGLYTYTATHLYLNNPAGEPTGGTFDIHTTVADDVSTTSADKLIVVNNVAPTIVIESVENQATGMITLTGVVSDPGTQDTETLSWTLNVNGTITMGVGPTFTFALPTQAGTQVVVSATAIDGDGDTGSGSAQIAPITQAGATVTVDSTGITVSAAGSATTTTSLAGANQVIVPVYGPGITVDASTFTGPLELDGYGTSETLIGGSGNDLLVAGPGNNSLVGGTGTDTLVSNTGDDTLLGGSGDTTYLTNPGSDPDIVDTGGFNILNFSIASLGITLDLGQDIGQLQVVDSNGDVVSLTGQFDEYIGSPNGDNITANSDDDLIYAGAGSNTITGGSGHDSIVGGTGNDIIYGGTGNSTITGGSGQSSVVGGTGNDIIYAGSGTSTITGGTGNDSVIGGSGNDIIYGGTGNSTITGGTGTSSIVGGSGNDIIYGGTGNNTITGGGGIATLIAGTGNDIIYGGTGNTTLTGGTGKSSIVGGSGNDIIFAGNGDTTITAGTGDDSVVGGTGDDIIYGGTGNTTITGGGGNDSIVGGTGNDIIYGGTQSGTLTGGTGHATIVGGSGNDIIYAGDGENSITGGSGDDSVVGGTGDDFIYGGTGNTTITGGGGNDTLIGGTGNDIIYGGSQSSTLTGGTGHSSVVGGTGNDIIYASNGNNTITGGSGNDSIVGGAGDDIIYGGTGNTTITGGGGNDTLIGGTGNDIIYGGTQSSTLTGGTGHSSVVGGTGNDIIYAGNGHSTITGGSGNTTIVGGSGNDIIFGGTGNDSIVGGTGSDSILGGSGNDVIQGSLESGSIVGGSGNDTIFGGDGNDTIYGGTGNDTIVGGAGEDSILGGSGDDIIYGGTLTSTLTGGSGNDSIFGSTGDDIIYGGTGNTTITGGTGNQSIVGGTGNDIIYGGPGDNTISGGGGSATISGGGGSDVLTGDGIDSWLMFYGSANMTLTDTTFTTSGGLSPASVTQISGFANAILAAGPGDYALDASGFSGGVILQGGTGDDTLIGSNSDDTLIGGAGNDSLKGGGGNDTFTFNSGSSGNQTIVEPAGTNIATLDFSAAPAGIQIDLGQIGPQTVIPGTLTLSISDPLGLSNVVGSPYDDTIIGNARNNTLIGGGGLDELVGLGGNDVLEGDVIRTVLLDFNTFELPGQHIYTQAERDAIQAQITADYSAFSYAFTQTAPASGPYTTIYFNDPALFGLEGGSATGIDWRDIDIAGSTTLTTTGLQVTPADTAEVNVNNLLGSPGEPAATSADFVALSATIAAHELGHLSGLEHGDSFGPIGSGIYAGVDPDLYDPPYPGPTDADETVMHIMASGASVNATLFDAIDDPFFGEREAIKLAYGENGSPTIEQTAAHYAMASAQPITLSPLVVPDTDLEGPDADQVFDVTAADVVGDLGLDASGNSLTDYYAFTAQAGTLINLQVMSAVLNRPQGAFDTALTVYDSSGNVVAYNDDSFQDSDSTIIDLTLPATGTYYVMVTSSAKSAALNEPLTGAYELFMYTFAIDGDPPAGDTLYAGSGDDTIIAGSADDTIVAGPTDSVLFGSGTATVMGKAPYLDVTAGPNQMTVNEGDLVNLTGSYVDPDDADTHTYDWTVTNAGGQLIADGTDQSFQFIPGNAGLYTVTFTVSDRSGGGASATVQVKADPVAPILTAPPTSQNAVAGESSSINLGTLNVKGIGPWSITVQWGDNQSSTYSPTGTGPLSLAHTYAREGNFTISETVSETDGDSTAITFPNLVVVVDQPLTMTGVPVSAIQNVPTGTVVVATFTDPEGADPLLDYSASINWGDGQPSTFGSISYNGTNGVFTVSGAYTYAEPGSDTISVMVTHTSAPTDNTTTVTSQATIAAPVTTTSLASSSASAVYGQAVTFTATVFGFGTPIGSVRFYSGPVIAADQVGTGTLSVVNGQDQATFSTMALTVSGSPYAITAVYGGDSSHEGSTSNTVSQTITPAPLKITASNAAMTYGGSLPSLSVTYSGLVDGDTPATFATAPNRAPILATVPATSNAGSYAITASGAYDPNYAISYAAGTLTVSAYAFTYTIANDSQTYGMAANLSKDLGTKINTGVNGQTLDIAYTSTGDTSTAHVNTYAITGALSSGTGQASDYSVTLKNGTLTVNKYAFTYAIANDSQTYGTAANLPKDLGTTINTGVNGQNLGIAYGSSGDTSSTHVGTYAITGTLSSGTGQASDYGVTLNNGTLTVNPAALTITANNLGKGYGQVNPTLTVSYSGFVNGDSSTSLTTAPSISTTATTKSPVGTYPITASGAVDPNYTIKYVAGTLTITTATLTITANNQSKVYGQVNPALTVSYAGFMNGDTSASLKTQPTVTTTATTYSAVGNYPITASGAVDPSYTIKYVAGTLTVSKDATTTIATVSSKTSPFGLSVTFTASVLANAPGSGTPSGSVDFFDTTTGDDLGTAALCGNAATLSTAGLVPGTHVITASYSGDSDFFASSASTSTLSINPSIIVLDPTASGALAISGNASIKVAGDVYVDSSSSSAIAASGSAMITAAAIDVHGSVQKSGSPTFSPAPTTKAASLSDPLATLPAPSTSGLTNHGSENLSGNSKATINPGIFGQISVAGNASLTMNAGLYIIEGGGFTVSANATVAGAGVTIVNAGSMFPNSGGTYGAISLSGNGTIKLTPATTGPFAGIVFIQPAANKQVLTFSANAMAGITGTIDAPSAQLAASVNAQLNLALDVDTLTLSGNAVASGVTSAAPAVLVAGTTTQIPAAAGTSSQSAILPLPLAGSNQGMASVTTADDGSIDATVEASASSSGVAASGPSQSLLMVLDQPTQPASSPAPNPGGAGTGDWAVADAIGVAWAGAIALETPIDDAVAGTSSRSSPAASVVSVALARTSEPGSGRPIAWTAALRPGLSPADSERPLGLQRSRWENNDALTMTTRQFGVVPEWILDDLVSDLVGSPGSKSRQDIGDPDRPLLVITGVLAGQSTPRAGGPLLAPVPAGPMSRPERPRRSGRPAASLASVLLVGGFSGFGASLLVARNSRAGSVSSRRPFLKFRTTRLP